MSSRQNCDLNEIKFRLMGSIPPMYNFLMSMKFSGLQNNCERINMIYDLMEGGELFAEFIVDKKDNVKANKLRQQGNKLFKKAKFKDALDMYNKSIAHAEEGGESLPLAYGNRSAVFFEKKYYEECLVDIEYALKSAYPEKLKSQLSERKEKALKLKEENKRMPVYEPVPVIPESEKNPIIECASSAIAIAETVSMGRHLIATKDLEVGEIIAVEKPFVQALLYQQETHCYDCLVLCYNLIPCRCCTQAMFCSETCRSDAWERYHKYECPILATMNDLNFDEEVRLAIKAAFASRSEFRNLKNTRNFNKNEPYKSDRINEFYKLKTHTKERTVSDLISKCCEACVIYELIEHHTSFLDDISRMHSFDGAKFFKGLLLTLMQIVVVNCGRVMELTPDKTQKDLYSDDILGYDLCSTMSLLNHSCAPNVLMVRHGNHKVLRVTESIKKGQPLLHNYIGVYTAVSKEARQEQLRQMYFFDCQCEACAKNWPTLVKLPLRGLGIPNELEKVKKPNIKAANEVLNKWLPKMKEIEKERPSFNHNHIQETIKQCFCIFGNKRVPF